MGWNIVSEELGEFIEILPPQKRVSEHWYQGTADAVYQNLYSIMGENPRRLIVLAGDHVYKMDYARMLRFHEERGAAVTLAALEVPVGEARRFGIVAVDEQDRTGFRKSRGCDPIPQSTDLASRRWVCTSSTRIARARARSRRATADGGAGRTSSRR
jgi:glucose-1-phosphate adenylyltransferase